MNEFLHTHWQDLLAWGVILLLFLFLRNRSSRIEGLDAVLGQGEPVVVEVFSNT